MKQMVISTIGNGNIDGIEKQEKNSNIVKTSYKNTESDNHTILKGFKRSKNGVS